MDEEKKKKIEAKLRQLLELHNESQKEDPPPKSAPPGTRVIRRRKGAPDKHIR